MPGPSLIDRCAALEDPRQSWTVLFPLPEVLLAVPCATLAGAEDVVEIRCWGQVHEEFLRRLLPFKAGVPSHDTLNARDGALFAKRFAAWAETLRDPAPASATIPELVAIDGNTSRRTRGRSRDRGPLHMVAAWAKPVKVPLATASGMPAEGGSRRLVLGQQACEAKANEITAIPLPLERLALTGALAPSTPSPLGGPTAKQTVAEPPEGARRPRSPRPPSTTAATTCWRSRATSPACTTR